MSTREEQSYEETTFDGEGLVRPSLQTRGLRTFEEERPSLRSVAIMGASDKASGLFSQPSLVGIPKPVQGLSGMEGKKTSVFPPPLKSSSPPLSQNGGKKNRSREQSLAGLDWRVTEVVPLPDDFPLERNSRLIPNVKAPEVSARISRCLRERFIEAKYDNVKATAKCRSPDFISFKISLFGEPSDNVNSGIIVEIQRRKGSSHCFMKECRAVMSAAEGSTTTETTVLLKRPCEMVCLDGIKFSERNDHGASVASEEGFQTTKRLLSDKNYDSHMLALESLEHLTNELHSDSESVVLAARNVIFPDEDNRQIHQAVTMLLRHGTLHPDKPLMTGPEDENDFNERMHNLALSTVLNAVRATDEQKLASAVVEQENWFSEVLIPVLLNDIQNAADQKHDALIAVHCMVRLIRCSQCARTIVGRAGAEEILGQVSELAKFTNGALLSEVEIALRLLRQA